MNQLVVFKGRTNVIPVSLGYDVSNDTFVSQIRVDKDPTSTLIATWSIEFKSNGVDGELILTLDDAITTAIARPTGYMDLKRVTGGEPVNVFDDVLEVLFKNTVTV